MKIKKHFIILGLILFLAFFLRFYHLSSNPPSLYWEEVALGYDAYSLLKTGRDHRGNSWPIVYLESYMDYKPPLYAYTLIPSIALFGLNEFGVRFPSAFFGSLTVLAVYFLVKELFPPPRKTPGFNKINPGVGELAALLLAISPWHLQFSRAAFEANLALFLVTTATLFFLKSISSTPGLDSPVKQPRGWKNLCLPLSAIFFSLSLYCYHGARVFTPLIVLILGFIFIKKLWSKKGALVFSIILGLILTFPLISSLKSEEVKQRFQETSIFTSLDPIIESNKKIAQAGGGLIARLIYHRYWEYARLFLSQYFKHFQGSYLFLSGDAYPRHSTQEFGQLYHWELFTLLIGIITLIKKFKKQGLVIFSWLLISPIPSALTKSAPHALRSLFGLPAFIIISGLGLLQLIKVLKKKKFSLITYYSLLVTLICLLFTELILYFHFYHYHYPKIHSSQWQYGYRQAITYIKNNEGKYDYIYLTNNYGRAYMYYLFYSRKDPFLTQKLMKPFKNNPNVSQLGKVFIGKQSLKEGRGLLVAAAGEASSGRMIRTINFLDGTVAFEIWEKTN